MGCISAQTVYIHNYSNGEQKITQNASCQTQQGMYINILFKNGQLHKKRMQKQKKEAYNILNLEDNQFLKSIVSLQNVQFIKIGEIKSKQLKTKIDDIQIQSENRSKYEKNQSNNQRQLISQRQHSVIDRLKEATKSIDTIQYFRVQQDDSEKVQLLNQSLVSEENIKSDDSIGLPSKISLKSIEKNIKMEKINRSESYIPNIYVNQVKNNQITSKNIRVVKKEESQNNQYHEFISQCGDKLAEQKNKQSEFTKYQTPFSRSETKNIQNNKELQTLSQESFAINSYIKLMEKRISSSNIKGRRNQKNEKTRDQLNASILSNAGKNLVAKDD